MVDEVSTQIVIQNNFFKKDFRKHNIMNIFVHVLTLSHLLYEAREYSWYLNELCAFRNSLSNFIMLRERKDELNS